MLKAFRLMSAKFRFGRGLEIARAPFYTIRSFLLNRRSGIFKKEPFSINFG